jgi:mycothiol synthase
MAVEIRPYRDSDHDALLGLLRSSDVRDQYEVYDAPDGVSRVVEGEYTPREGVRLAFVDGEPAGFACAIVLPGPPQAFAVLRGAVYARFRRRGIGRALFDAVREFALTQRKVPGLRELAFSAWEPFDPAQAMAGSLGYQPDRSLWLMERPRGAAVAEPVWPAGVTVRALDGSDASLLDWNEAFNRSFEGTYRYVYSPVEHVREMATKSDFRPDAILIAYRQGAIAGFCRNELYPQRVEIGTLGTTPVARGIGLGRALLRWGIAWLERESTLPVTLIVDGQNETALRLYRSEGFEVRRTRRTWAKPIGDA